MSELREGFNCYRSYYDVAKELSEEERNQFLWALFQKQFEGIEPQLTGMAKFAWTSQKHSIERQVKGWEDKTRRKLTPLDTPLTKGSSEGGNYTLGNPPCQQEKEKGEVKEKEKGETRALEFLQSNFPSRFEQDFLMKHKSHIKDFEKFCEDFNDTVDQEELKFDDKILFGRLGKYARNWIQNQNKYSKNHSSQNSNPSSKIPIG